MSNSLYITAIDPDSGKSLVVLGITELISRRGKKLGFFRPMIRGGGDRDNTIELIRSQYSLSTPYESHYATTYEQALDLTSAGREQELLELILTKYKQLEAQCDFVICVGTDFTGINSSLEFDFNARIANHLGCPVLIVGNGVGKSSAEAIEIMRSARQAFVRERCTIAASIINRVVPEELETLTQKLQGEWNEKDPVFALPERSELAAPTIGEIAKALSARVLHGDPGKLMREAQSYKIAAMQLRNFLKHVEQNSLVITPGDRADIILACLVAFHSESFPHISGLVLTGGLELDGQVDRLIRGLSSVPIPVLLVNSDTHSTSQQIDRIRAAITPDNDRKIAAALSVFEVYIDQEVLAKRIEVTRSTSMTPLMFEYDLLGRARANQQHLVLPEGIEERVLKASETLLRRDVARLTLLGDEKGIRNKIAALGLEINEISIIDPRESKLRDRFAKLFVEIRSHKGMTYEVAADMMLDVNYFGTMMVQEGLADGLVSGAAHTTAQTIRPAFQIIKTRDNCATASSVFFMCLADCVLVYGDCAINPNPNSQQLADIAIASAETASMFGIDPRVAMLSYSTGKSGHGEDVEKVVEATEFVRTACPELKIEGPIQYDAAVDARVASTKMPHSEVAGQANVLVFPDLNTGNNTYKAVQRSADALAIGPVLQGLRKPVNDLSRGCTVSDIVNTVAITAVQAQMMKSP